MRGSRSGQDHDERGLFLGRYGLSSGLAKRARHALYAMLLRWSRLGFAITRHSPDQQAMFSLNVLRQTRRERPAVVADDDDASGSSGRGSTA